MRIIREAKYFDRGVTMSKEFKWRWLFFFGGLLVLSLGVTMTIKGKVFGTAPWDVLHIGLFKQFGLSIGTWSMMIGLLIIVATSLYLRKLPRIATFFNMIGIGLFIDCFNWLLPNTSNNLFELLYFIAGFFIMSIGVGLYIAADLGAGPRDTIMMIMASKGIPVRISRMIMEVFAAVLGYLLHGPVGVGTVVLALGSGYIIQPSLFYFKGVLTRILQS